MPGYTPNSNIPFPLGSEPIRGTLADNVRVDLEQLALGADAADVATRVGAVEDSKEALNPRLQFSEMLAAEPGTWLKNYVVDPKPLDAPANYTGGRVSFIQAPGWGRASCTAVGATSVIAGTGGVSDRGVPVVAGNGVAASWELRSMPTQSMDAKLTVYASTLVDGALTNRTAIADTGMVTLGADVSRVFALAEVVPSGFDHVEVQFSFRRTGATNAEVGDFVFFRKAMLTVGTSPAVMPSATYFDGDSADSYWEGAAGASKSVTAKPRGAGSGLGAGAAHAALVDDWSHRMGGLWHCGKTTTVSVRVDHGLANFWSKFKPILDGHGIPATIALGADTWGISENSGVTASMVNAAVATGRYAIAAHGWGNHLDTASPALLRKYIVDAKVKLEADIPAAAPIDIFMPPGASGNGSWGGFLPSSTPDKYSGTFAGQLALSTYPICSGQFSGTSYRVQDGEPRIGQSYFNMDTFTDSQVLSRVNTAVSEGRGIQLMIHPSLIDSGPGYITTAQLASLFTTLKTMHDAGTIRFVSVAQQYLADSTSVGFKFDTDGVPYF